MHNLDGLVIEDKGKNNKVSLGENVRAINSKFLISGNSNSVVIESGVVLNNVTIVMDSDSNLAHFKQKSRVTCRVIQKLTHKNEFVVGENTSIGGANIINGEGSAIKIGSNCMLSYDIDIRSTDSHGIFDLTTEERVNHAKNITIGNDVWIAAHTTLCKGVCINDGSVVGIGSVVTSQFNEKNIVVCGNPARKIKEGIYWKRELLG